MDFSTNTQPHLDPTETPRKQNTLEQLTWLLWPVHRHEQSQIIPMTAILFCVSFIYNILGALKKTLLLSSPCIKAQAVSYLKIFAIMPAALLFTWMTAHVQSQFGQKRALQLMVAFFGIAFTLLTLVIIPHRECLVLHLSGNFELISLLNNWDITLFYVLAEMWSSIILNVLCWGLIIETTHLSQSKRIFALFTASANIATLFAGWWAAKALDSQLMWFYSSDLLDITWHQRMLFQMGVMWLLQAGIMTLLSYYQPAQKEQSPQNITIVKPQKKIRISLLEAIKITAKNPVLRNIALMMIGYNMIYHLSDVTHSAYVKEFLSHNSDLMNKYFNSINLYLGICAVAFSWLLSGSFIRRYGLKVSLWVTPLLWFFLSSMDAVASLSNHVGFSWNGTILPLHLISLSILLSVGRAIKYTIFDTSKEMSFLGLSSSEKRMGKSAIDGLSSRFGKSGGAWILIAITSQAGGQVIASLFPIKIVIFAGYLLWFYSVYSLVTNLPQEESPSHQEESPPQQQSLTLISSPQRLCRRS